MKVQFIKDESTKTVKVELNGEKYGKLIFDIDQDAWVLWPDQIDDGITYFDDLKETEDQIKFELEHADD